MYVNISDDRFDLFKTKLKNKVEFETGAEISINENVKTVNINHSNSVKEMDTKRVIKAINLGFNLRESLKLYRKTPSRFENINIRDHTRNNKEFHRQKGRIIGKDGRTKELISEYTDTDIVISGDSIGVIGYTQDVIQARQAILKLITGTPHSRVYHELEQYHSNKAPSQMV